MTQIPKSNSDEKWIEVKFFIPASWRKKLQKKAEEKGCRTISELVRDFLREYIEAEQ